MGKRPVSSLASCHGSSPFEERRFPHPAVDSEESSAVRDDRVASVQGALHLALLATQSPARHFASLDHHRLFLRQIHPIRLHHAITRQTQVPRSKVKPRYPAFPRPRNAGAWVQDDPCFWAGPVTLYGHTVLVPYSWVFLGQDSPLRIRSSAASARAGCQRAVDSKPSHALLGDGRRTRLHAPFPGAQTPRHHQRRQHPRPHPNERHSAKMAPTNAAQSLQVRQNYSIVPGH